MRFKKGDRVKHPARDDWELGEVLANNHDGSIKVFFVGVGEKTLLLEYIQPVKVTGDEAIHPVLDNLKINKSSGNIKYQKLSELTQFFLEQFPEGFHGEKFIEEERKNKDNAHTLAQLLLGQEAFHSLLENECYAEITKCALKITNATNLIFPNEKMALKDGLKETPAQKEFSIALYSLLHGTETLEQRFVEFAKLLEKIDAAKWTIATYFLFIMHPSKHMFVKPTITQYASELCGMEINYKPQLNWRTYQSVLTFSEYLFSEMSELKPRDMIDIQSFMWRVAPGKIQRGSK